MTESNVAVLIDYENVGLDSVQDLLDQLSDIGRIIIKRAYADWSVQRSKRDQLLEMGIEAVHHFRSNNSGKNSSDICLAIDAVDLLYGAPVDTFVIVSSDSDFVPLVSKLRAAGKSVIGSGRRGVTSPTLVKSCDRYVYLSENKVASPRRLTPQHSRDSDVNTLVVRAMEASMDDQGQVVGSKLHNTMQRIDPSFNFKSQGYRTFRQFLSSCKEVTFTQPEDASDVVVQLAYARERGYNFPAPTADGHTNNSEESSQPEDKGRRPSRRRSPRGPRSQQGRGGEHSAIQPQVEPQTSDPQPVESAVLPETVAEVEPAVSTNGHVPAIARSAEWDIEVDRLWSERNRDSVFGPVAAGDAAKALGVSKLSASEYPSLDALLEASPLLRSKWRRERNRIQKI